MHDTGKLLYRFNDSRNHSDSGYDFLKNIINDSEILNCIRYHHAAKLRNSGVSDDSICYITYISDNIAAFSDRRKNETGESGFVKNVSYESIFNILNGNNGKSTYKPTMLTEKGEINYPSEDDVIYDESFYSKVTDTLKNAVRGIEEAPDYVNSLIEISEACMSYIPSSTQIGELRDISLYDHVKLTSAIALCIYDYAIDNNISNYKSAFFDNADSFYNVESFQLYSADISGIQNFIYNISRKAALKGLRSRSFYLEIIMEHYVDTIIERLELARCNVLYTGGGHTYMLVPNTKKVSKIISDTENEINQWFSEKFGTELFIAGGLTSCSANSLRNIPEGSFKKIFSETSKKISHHKLRRYNASDLMRLNSKKINDSARECAVCHSSDNLINWNDDYICRMCNSLIYLSGNIIENGYDQYFTIITKNENFRKSNYVSLPFDCCLVSDNAESLTNRMKYQKEYIRSYSKNNMYTGKRIASKLWVGDYSAENDFSDLVDNSEGINRLCVLRADVDNLGSAFVNGFPEKYTTISRTSEFSAKLSLFFKHDINTILNNPVFSVTDKKRDKRNISVIYSGGDDIFVVGGWDDVIGFAVDLNESLEKFSQGTLTISAGIGMFSRTYPLYAMAEETGQLEEYSKENEGKNSITLFDKSGRYRWNELKNKVIGEKFQMLKSFLYGSEERGKSMLYKMLELIRDKEDENRLNLARFAYLLARVAPSDIQSPDYDEKYTKYREFKNKMYSWINSEDDCRQLVTAIYLYIYSVRKKENDND